MGSEPHGLLGQRSRRFRPIAYRRTALDGNTSGGRAWSGACHRHSAVQVLTPAPAETWPVGIAGWGKRGRMGSSPYASLFAKDIAMDTTPPAGAQPPQPSSPPKSSANRRRRPRPRRGCLARLLAGAVRARLSRLVLLNFMLLAVVGLSARWGPTPASRRNSSPTTPGRPTRWPSSPSKA